MNFLNKKQVILLGINSGTSADSIDLSAVKFTKVKNNNPQIKIIANKAVRFNPELQKNILRTADSDKVSIADLVRLDQAVGVSFGKAAKAFITSLRKKNIIVDAISSHGQTICHLPEIKKYAGYLVRGSLQIGSPEQIAAICKLPVIADMRQSDIAFGGEGAPITTDALGKLVADRNASRVVVNIGGIANYFYFPSKSSKKRAKAGDIGPGNILSDMICRRLFNKAYDKNGQIAKKGNISKVLLKRINQKIENSLKKNSTGREAFRPVWIDEMLTYARKNRMLKEDILATIIELTALCIVNQIELISQRDKNLSKLYLTGGGAHNRFLVQRIRDELQTMDVAPISELGLDIDFVESASYAVIGYTTIQCLLSSSYGKSGLRSDLIPVPGRIIQPPVRRKK